MVPMSAALDRTWSLRPHRPGPRDLDELAALARRDDRPLRARVRVAEGWAELCFAGPRLVHAKLGWTLGTRALRRIAAAGPWREVGLEHDGGSTLVTVDRPWSSLRLELLRM